MPNKLPFVAAACLCERVLQEKDGVLSVIRMIDVLTMQAATPPPADNQVPILLTVFVSLKAGDVRGEHDLTLRVRRPSGATKVVGDPTRVPLADDPVAGANLIAALPLLPTEFGLIWIDVLWDGDVLTSIPFRLLLAEDKSGQQPEQKTH